MWKALSQDSVNTSTQRSENTQSELKEHMENNMSEATKMQFDQATKDMSELTSVTTSRLEKMETDDNSAWKLVQEKLSIKAKLEAKHRKELHNFKENLTKMV